MTILDSSRSEINNLHLLDEAKARIYAQPDKAAPDYAPAVAILKRILAAHQSGNNGAVMGEAILCRQFEIAAEEAIAKAEVRS